MMKNDFNITEVKGIKDKISSITVYGKNYKKMKYNELLNMLIHSGIDIGLGNILEASGLIKFNGKSSTNSMEYKGYTYIVPKRKDDLIDRIIKFLTVTEGNTDSVYVEFISSREEVLKNMEERQNDKELKKAQQLSEKMCLEKELMAEKIFNVDLGMSDDDIREIIINQEQSEEEFVRRITNIDKEREALERLEMDRIYSQIRWVLNDEKQAELFNVSVEEYRERFKERNIHDDKETSLFMDYVKQVKANLNSEDDDNTIIDFMLEALDFKISG